MNIITFTYTKADGSESKRVLSPVVTPATNYEGVDISELDMEVQVKYVQALGKLRDEYIANVNLLNSNFDVKNRYRCFDPSRMTDVVKEAI